MLTVHMDQSLTPRPFMKIINILGDDQQFAGPRSVKTRQSVMRRIGLRLLDCFTPHVVETQHQIGIARIAFRRRDVFNTVLLPKPARAAEGINATFRADTSAGEDDDVAKPVHLPQ